MGYLWLLYALIPILLVLVAVTVGFPQPSWEGMNKFTGVDRAVMPVNLGPSRKTIEDIDLTMIHEIMGASCLMLGVPMMVFIQLHNTNLVGQNAMPRLALAICVYDLIVALWSYLGDFYYANTKQVDFAGAEPREGEIRWWQKMLICNKIDIVFAVINTVVLTALGLLIILVYWHKHGLAGLLSSNRLIFSLPLMPLIWADAVGVKFLANQQYQAYADTGNANSLLCAFFLHTMWHVGGATLTCILIYELMTNGIGWEK